MIKPFVMDGIEYNIDVMSIKRKFSVLDTDKSGRTQDGEMYRDIVGTYYNYSMTVAQKGDDAASLDKFWEAVSKPRTSHTCVFPYGQSTLSQEMYITSGEQDVNRIYFNRTDWNEITLNFIAMSPKVLP